MAGAEAITCCGWRETHGWGVLGDGAHCRRAELIPWRATDPVAFTECSPSNAAELRSETSCWLSGPGGRIRDEQCRGCRETRWAWSSLSCGLFSPSSVVEMMGSSIATILSQGRTRGSLFHLSVHDVTADYPTHTWSQKHQYSNSLC
jgi:hypothetical protein